MVPSHRAVRAVGLAGPGQGNVAAMKSGCYSPRVVDSEARGLVEQVLALDEVAYLRQPQWAAAVWRWARQQARADLLHGWLVRHGTDCQGCKSCLGWETRWLIFDTAADRASRRLGLDPLSRSRLARDVTAAAVDVASIFARYAAEDAAKVDEEGGGDAT